MFLNKNSFLSLVWSVVIGWFLFFPFTPAFAASTTDTNITASGFSVQKIDFLDDRTVEITFSEPLAQEPVEISLLEETSGKTIGIKEIIVKEPERIMTTVKTSQSLSPSMAYTILVASARSMMGNSLNQTDGTSGTGVTTSSSLPLSPESSDSKKEPTISIEEALKKAQETGEVTTKATTVVSPTGSPEKTNAPLSSSSVNSSTDVSSEVTMNSAPTLTKQLPKTGPAEWILLFGTLLVTFLVFIFKRKRS